MKQMISELTDTDFYKFTMQQVVYNNYANVPVRYEFKCRNEDIDLSALAGEIQEQIFLLCSLRLGAEEIDFLESIPFLSKHYVRSLRDLRLSPDAICITTNPFTLTIEGNWYETILYEVPLLAIINEVYFEHTQPDNTKNWAEGQVRLEAKCDYLEKNCPSYVDFNLIEFGTRRRYSADWQLHVGAYLRDRFLGHSNIHFQGTSNVMSARKNGIKPHGTMAHEYLQAHQALAPLHKFQSAALQTWANEYKGDLGIALSDVVGMDSFLLDFHKGLAMLYSGARHDSGDPFVWGEKLIQHYKALGIDPRGKNAVFSDGLDMQIALKLAKHFSGRIRPSFGVGTNLTNDLGFKPLNIVIKMTECDGQPVAKLSDSPGKAMCKNDVYLAYLNDVIQRGIEAVNTMGA